MLGYFGPGRDGGAPPRPAAQNHPCAQRDDFLSGLPGLLGTTVFPGDGGRENSAFFSSGEPKTSQFQKKKEGLRGKDTSLFYFYNERTGESVTGNPQKFLQSFWEQSIKSAERWLPQKESAKGGGKLLSALCAEGVFRLVFRHWTAWRKEDSIPKSQRREYSTLR